MRRQVGVGALAGFLGVAGVTTGSALAGMIETEGLKPWEVCALCHNLDGVSRTARFPHLAGQKTDYLQKQLRDFRAGHRSNDNGQMTAIVEAELAETNIQAVADYFAALAAPPPTPADVSAAGLARGQALFERGAPEAGIPACAGCHGAAPPEIAHAPHITAQHADYVAKQLADFKSGARSNDVTNTMPRIAGRLSDTDIASVARYVATRPRAGRQRSD